jgi:hypothetical protein
MASKTVPAKKKSTTTTEDAQEPTVTTIKKATSKNLQGIAVFNPPAFLAHSKVLIKSEKTTTDRSSRE